MKTISPVTILTFAAALATAFLLRPGILFAGDTKDKTDRQFPHVIKFEFGMGASNFYAGDQITITSVRGNRAHIEPGGSYLVEGFYTLSSANSNELMLYCTTKGPSDPTPVQDGERNKITRGSGRFYLYETNLADGWLHVCFSSLHGNVYFGEKGRENTIKRDHTKILISPN
jgi:hypothetical protein